MNVLGIVGSKRKRGNTAALIKEAIRPFEEAGDTCEIINLGSLSFDGCHGCEACATTNRCVIKDDMQPLYKKIREADALVLGSPTYFYDMSSDMKKFIERCYCFCTFHKDDRSLWYSEFEKGDPKYAGVIAVCEQKTADNLGYTGVSMRDGLISLGFRNVFLQGALHAFKAGEILADQDQMALAYTNGVALRGTVLLARS